MSRYTYEILINDSNVDYFALPFELDEERIRVVCQTEIRKNPEYEGWAQLFLNNSPVYRFPIVNEEDLTKYKVEVKLHK